jgi:acetylornithine deacetylase/succinyl-diaminopimelate desuccinylase-like protein
MTKTEKLLRELVALPSVNPAFVAPGDARAGERNVAEFLAATAAQAGLEVSFQPVFRGRSNVFARLTPSGKMRRRILLAPHLDTVSAEESQFTPQKKGRRLFGRGASDAKGCVAAMMSVMCELANSRQRPAETEITFVGLVDEEHAQAGSRALAEKGFHADLAIVGEPTRLEVVTAHKGLLWLRLETRGKSAHGALPNLGRNAVHAMARIVDLLQTRYAAQLARKRHPLLGSPTVNVGVISGGTQANIVPDECTIVVDRRTLPGESGANVWRELRNLLKAHGLQAKCVDDKQAPCLPLETNPKNPLVKRFLHSVGQRRPAGVHYFCDAAILAESGIPSIAFGPGDIAQGHTADEWISLDSLERGRALLLNFLRSLP